jgi:ABC-type nitrate/sulfonate/bicarbonate transport system substrate-binding protein
MSNTIKIGGVPEHFILPILLAAERGEFKEKGIDLQWGYYPGGTGAMTKALADGELDMAILLTEGFVSAVNNGLQAKIVKVYIDSPLVWGIYAGTNSATKSIYDNTLKKYAISRFGSGSHLMAMIHAEQRGEKIAAEDFVIINSLEGAIKSLTKNETQAFYWEKFMTKKYVESGEVKLIGEFSASWSSFLIVATEKSLTDKKELIEATLSVINTASRSFKEDPFAQIELKKRFHLSNIDIQHWMHATAWNTDLSIRRRGLQNAIDAVAKVSDKPMNIDIATLCNGSLTLNIR